MALIRIGILSDTHLSRPTESFKALVEKCFADVSIIFHAGDLTDISILSAFTGKEVYAVHGNMCNMSSRDNLPAVREITFNVPQGHSFQYPLEGYKSQPSMPAAQLGSSCKIILCHGYGYGYHDIEDHLFSKFAEADCIVYGHTHAAVCHRLGHILFINPGSFGNSGTYAILEIDRELRGRIKQIPELP